GNVHRMAGVRPALIANHPVSALGEHVHQLALALVSPLRSDDDDGTCICIEHYWVSIRRTERPKKQTPRELRGVGSIYPSGRACQRSAGGGGGTSSMTRGGSSGRTTLLIGSTTVKVDPFPKTLSANTCPPSASTSFRVMLSPRPVPPNSRVLD